MTPEDEARAVAALEALRDDPEATTRSPKGTYFKSLDRARCEKPTVEDVTDVQVLSDRDYDVSWLRLHIVTRSGRVFECLSPSDPISLFAPGITHQAE